MVLARVSGSSNPLSIPSDDRPFRQLASFLQRAEQPPRASRTLAALRRRRFPTGSAANAFRWRKSHGVGYLQPIARLPAIQLDDLHDIDEQKARIDANTRHFVAGQPANNVLLTGARGSGKSSLIKALLNAYAAEGLRVIEVEKGDLTDLPDIVELIDGRPERFIIFCDDLSFDSGDARYKALKVVLDGSIAAAPENVLIYATSNRRHLMPEYFAENLESKRVGEEIHPGEAIEEKISLSERFGLWISFYPFDQDAYLNIVAHWLKSFGCAAGRDRRLPSATPSTGRSNAVRAAAASPGSSRVTGRGGSEAAPARPQRLAHENGGGSPVVRQAPARRMSPSSQRRAAGAADAMQR
jgi:predicted AAA+ superfamily ATPase